MHVYDTGLHALQVVEPYVFPAATVIDWTDIGAPIGDRPLREYHDRKTKQSLGWHCRSPATLRRVEMGLRMFARPAVIASDGQTWDSANPLHPRHCAPDSYYQAWDSLDPLTARQAGGTGDGIAIPPHMIAVNHDGDARARTFDSGPLTTLSTKIGDRLVFPPVVTHHYGDSGGRTGDRRVSSIESSLGSMTTTMSQGIAELYGTGTIHGIAHEALSAVDAGGKHYGVAIPPEAFISKHHGGLGHSRI